MTDIYCYSCDDAKLDPELPSHLQTFGISVLGQEKTEKSMTELVGFGVIACEGSNAHGCSN